jgi:8-hydroxy-5-deazaflavin:NADPH oxidoreductase
VAAGSARVIGIIGGTGDFGQGLAERLRRLGEEVVLGSRTPHDEFVSNAEATQRSDIVFLSVPPDGVEFMCRNLADELAGRIVVSVASPVVFVGGRPAAQPGELSLAEIAQKAAPRCRVVAGFHTVSAKALARVDDPLDEDVILCSDDAEAKQEIAVLAENVIEGRAVDAGPLMVARWLEPVTAVILNVNRNYRVQTGVRITGIPT